MAFDTPVNSQITDAITQINTMVLGVGPAQNYSNMMAATSQAMGNAAHNATHHNMLGNILALGALKGAGGQKALTLATAARGVDQIFDR